MKYVVKLFSNQSWRTSITPAVSTTWLAHLKESSLTNLIFQHLQKIFNFIYWIHENILRSTSTFPSQRRCFEFKINSNTNPHFHSKRALVLSGPRLSPFGPQIFILDVISVAPNRQNLLFRPGGPIKKCDFSTMVKFWCPTADCW